MPKLRQLLAPKLSWAFPTGAHHQLILAAIGQDHEASLDAAHTWLSENDIDEAEFRDHRLLLAVSARFGTELKKHSAYPRLVGLQRMLWTRSMMAMQEARPSLARIAEAGHEMLLIKGAACLASGAAASKQRVAYDIDLVVRPEFMAPVFDILVDEDWTPSPGTTCQYIREHLASTRSINLFKGNWGDIDLHRQPFHPGQGGSIEDAQLWETSQPAKLNGVPVRIPSSEDRVALAIAHGGLDGHAHSDWLVDCATILQGESIDWQRLGKTILSRRSAVSAAITFQYLHERLGFEIPSDFMQTLATSASSQLSALYVGLVQARPKDRSGPAGQVIRAIAKKVRKLSGRRHLPAKAKDRELSVRRVAVEGVRDASTFVTSFRIVSPPECKKKSNLDVDIILDIKPPAARRRIELEIGSVDTHLCRARFRKWAKNDAPLRLHLSGTIDNPPTDSDLELISRPSRQLRSFASEEEKQRYESLAFRVVSCKVA